MSTHDNIELPPLPVPRTKTDGGIELFAEYSVREYARAAIEPYKQRISELEAQLEAVGAGGVSSQRITSPSGGVSVAWRYLTPTGWHATTDAAQALRIAEHHTVEPLYAAPQPAEPVGYVWKNELEHSGADHGVDGHSVTLSYKPRSGMMPIFTAPQPAEPVKVPSEDERAAQGLPPYKPRHLTEEEWSRLTESGRRAWGKKPDEPEKEPPCET